MKIINDNAKAKLKEGRKIKKRLERINKAIDRAERIQDGSVDHLLNERYSLETKLANKLN